LNRDPLGSQFLNLAGEIWQWNADCWRDYEQPCNGCVAVGEWTYPSALGGGFKRVPEALYVALRVQRTPSERDAFFRARCARRRAITARARGSGSPTSGRSASRASGCHR
jgi:formylglycine-generating enzyme required for sulfatase activity